MDSQYPGEMRLLPINYVLDLHDVICGRGKKCFNHYGNECFRKVIDDRLDEYTKAASKIEKTMIIREIIANIREKTPLGGFVKYDPMRKTYFEIGETLAREKTSQAFRDALYGMNSAPKVKRSRGGKTRRIILNKNHMINGDGIMGYMIQDCMQDSGVSKNDDDGMLNAVYDNQNKVREHKTLGMSLSNNVTCSASSRSFIPFKNIVKECDENVQWLSNIDRKQSINQDRAPFRRYFVLEDNDDIDDWKYNTTSQPKFGIDNFQTEKSDNKHGCYAMASELHHCNDDVSKSLLIRYNDETAKSWFNSCNDGESKAWFDAVSKSAKTEETPRSFDCYRSQINDILLGRMIEKSNSPSNQRRSSIDFNRRCSIDSLIQAVEIGEIDPFEPTPY